MWRRFPRSRVAGQSSGTCAHPRLRPWSSFIVNSVLSLVGGAWHRICPREPRDVIIAVPNNVSGKTLAYNDLREWIAALERAGELKRIQTEVDPVLEIAEITDRVSKSRDAKGNCGGPAL